VQRRNSQRVVTWAVQKAEEESVMFTNLEHTSSPPLFPKRAPFVILHTSLALLFAYMG
jgi:hypothetical protein